MIRSAGVEPLVIEYLQTPPDRATLTALLARMEMRPRDLLRQKGTPYEALGLAEAHWSDEQLLTHMLECPILINRPDCSHALGGAAVSARRARARNPAAGARSRPRGRAGRSRPPGPAMSARAEAFRASITDTPSCR